MTPALSRRCSNQLSYRPKCGLAARNAEFRILNFRFEFDHSKSSIQHSKSRRRRWWRHGDSNPRHPACKAGALPTELYPPVASEARKNLRKEKDQVVRCVPVCGTRGIFVQIIISFRCESVARFTSPFQISFLSFQPFSFQDLSFSSKGLDLSQ